MQELDTPSREWSALVGLLDQALELPEGHRERWIEALPSEYDTIRPRLRRLLLQSDSTAFLHTIPKVADGTDLPVSAGDTPGPIAAYRIRAQALRGRNGDGLAGIPDRCDGEPAGRPQAAAMGVRQHEARRVDGRRA